MSKLTLYKLVKVFENQKIKCSHTDCPHPAEYGQSFSSWVVNYYCKDHWPWSSEAKLEPYLIEPEVENEVKYGCCEGCND